MTVNELLEELDQIKSLDNNWDGYGAVKVLSECIENTKSLINQLNCDKVSDIYANPNGTISIVWENNLDDYIEVEIGKTEFALVSSISKDLITKDKAKFDKININLLKDIINIL